MEKVCMDFEKVYMNLNILHQNYLLIHFSMTFLKYLCIVSWIQNVYEFKSIENRVPGVWFTQDRFAYSYLFLFNQGLENQNSDMLTEFLN